MMISPEAYYEMCLKGRSPEEILRQIRSLKKEISSLKRSLEENTGKAEPVVFPSPLTRISCSRDYLEMAKRAYEAAGGLSDLHMGEWKRSYMDPCVLDGSQWQIRIAYEDGRKPVKLGGSNAYPYNFRELLELLGIDKTI